MRKSKAISQLLAAALLTAGFMGSAQAQVRITEWMYNGSEFVEFTNLGATSVNFSGWSFDDDSRTAGVTNLSAFGTVASGESVILAEASASAFRTTWGLLSSVKVIGGNTNNLGRGDEINLYDNTNTLVDRLTYSDQTFAGTIRTNNISGYATTKAALGTNNVALWTLSVAGDKEGSKVSATGGFIGSPGITAAVPEPETYALLLAGLGLVGAAVRRRKA